MKYKIIATLMLTFLIKVFLINAIFDFDYYNILNGGRDILYFLSELMIVIFIASLMYLLLGKIKDQSVSFKRGLVWTLAICTTVFVGFNTVTSAIDNTRPHQYAITIVQGDEATVQAIRQLEESYPEKIISIENLNSFEELSPSMTKEKELKKLHLSIFLYIRVLKRAISDWTRIV